MTELSEQERFRRAVAGDALLIGTLTNVIAENYGDKGLEALRNGLEKTYRQVMSRVAKQAGVRTADGGIEDWAKLERIVGDMFNLEYEIEATPTRGTIRITQCPMAEQYRRTSPDFCPVVLIGLERGIASAINPRMKVHGARYLTRGDDCCEIVCELKD